MAKRFSMFEGVFTPTLLSILGVIMYLRLGWVVGQVGLLSALVIILLANAITIATALSMSSIVTNIRIGTGGAYSIITKSLGVEAGGAIGIPLYLSQAISVAFYITGFSEVWLWIFPQHDMIMVSLAVWLGVVLISYFSARFAFRIQYVIMAVVAFSLLSIALGGDPEYMGGASWRGAAPGQFWVAFAIFFPAVTGVLAGASMSGELTDARKAIPRGTLSAIGVSLVVYIFLAVWLGTHISSSDLVSENTLLIELGRWRWAVVAGVMGATLSSALSMFVGAPRTLLALGENRMVPFGGVFSRLNGRAEPTAAVLLTALIVLTTFLFGTLDTVAKLLTQIFLITYGMINLSVFIEQSIGIPSFRPSFRIPRWVSLAGSVGCFSAMFVIDARFTLIALAGIIVLYMIFVRGEMKTRTADVRSGLLIFLAETLVKAASRLPYHPKVWKPNIIFPLIRDEDMRHAEHFLRQIISPAGRLLLLKIVPFGKDPRRDGAERIAVHEQMAAIVTSFRDEALFAEQSVLEARDPLAAVTISLQLTRQLFLPPNTLFSVMDHNADHDGMLREILKRGIAEGLGLMVLALDLEKRFKYEQTINLWMRKGSPNIHLAILTAIQLQKSWGARIRILQAVSSEAEESLARDYLERVRKGFRLPENAEMVVMSGDFRSVLVSAPPADIDIFGMQQEPDIRTMRNIYELTSGSVVFLRDSAHESAVA
ncbi:MAG: amino acid permease [Candidatus Omnitrophota bacterium]